MAIRIEGDANTRDDVGTTRRNKLSPTARARLFEQHGGRCVLCTRKIISGEPWVDEHLRALGLGGGNEPANRAPVHVACARIKTQAHDMPAIVKAKRTKRASLGLKESRWPPLPGSRRSKWKRKMDGSIERRGPHEPH